jgi:hypothetical protein
MLVEKYGGVAKLQGIWGVSGVLVLPVFVLIQWHCNGQSKQLYIADPTALHHIFVKDQYSYELANWLVE